MRLFILLSVLCSTSALSFSLHRQYHRHENRIKRQGTWESTTTEGNTVLVYDYTVIEDLVTLKPGELPPSRATHPAAAVQEKLGEPSVGEDGDGTNLRYTSSSQPAAAPSPSTTEVASSFVHKSESAPQAPTPSTASASLVASGQTNKVITTISSLTLPTASVLGENNKGTVCTASVPQLPTAFAEYAVAAHNVHRANHSSPPIIWDNDLASSAASWASYCTFSHNKLVGSVPATVKTPQPLDQQMTFFGHTPTDIISSASQRFWRRRLWPKYWYVDSLSALNLTACHG